MGLPAKNATRAGAWGVESVGYIALRRLVAVGAIVQACSGPPLDFPCVPLVALASQAVDLPRVLYDDFRIDRDEL